MFVYEFQNKPSHIVQNRDPRLAAKRFSPIAVAPPTLPRGPLKGDPRTVQPRGFRRGPLLPNPATSPLPSSTVPPFKDPFRNAHPYPPSHHSNPYIPSLLELDIKQPPGMTSLALSSPPIHSHPRLFPRNPQKPPAAGNKLPQTPCSRISPTIPTYHRGSEQIPRYQTRQGRFSHNSQQKLKKSQEEIPRYQTRQGGLPHNSQQKEQLGTLGTNPVPVPSVPKVDVFSLFSRLVAAGIVPASNKVTHS